MAAETETRARPAPPSTEKGTPSVGAAPGSDMDVEYEHALWACAAGLRPFEVITSVGAAWLSWREPGWHDAVTTLRWARRTILDGPAQ